ncbi:MAG: N-6 DNA methylase [Treponema sp.]|jgi:type I restriction-modification system DNA methylase subunit|nr:N-6 DNA methylase [Treponema sp.]
MEILMQKETIGEKLGVSPATVNNWIKTAVIPSPDRDNYYSKTSFDHIIGALKNSPDRLNARANRSLQKKKEICYLGIIDKKRKKLLDALIEEFEKSDLTIDDGVLAFSIALLRSNKMIKKDWQANRHSKIDALLSDWFAKSARQEMIRRLYAQYEIPNLDDDILGAFYQSIQSVSQKSNTGSYYTSAELLKEIQVSPDKIILDPCCGSGGILLNTVTKAHKPSKIFARDIDETALKICFINFALFFNDNNTEVNISKRDITAETSGLLFNYIVTNPPWGSKFSKKEKENFIALYPELETAEIFSISLYNSLKLLKKDGELFFFLPHSFLNVAAHRNIRNYIFTGNNKIVIKLLGSAFKGVLSESILLFIKKDTAENAVTIKDKTGSAWQLPRKGIAAPDYIVSATSNGKDTALIEKIYNTEHITLQNGAVFALGLVTGNNKKFLLNKKTEKAEAVFRGKDIEKYTFSEPEYFIEFQPEMYQQTAPVEYYRQKKIVYRFICDKLVCALDNDNALLLNSANLFISKDYPMETIVSFFNSGIYTFIFRKKFHSKKVLKSHLQNLPLPVLSSDMHEYIYNLYNNIFVSAHGSIEDFQREIDEIICKSFSIDKTQYDYIFNALNNAPECVILRASAL